MASLALFGLLLAVNHVVSISAMSLLGPHITHDGQASSSVVGKDLVPAKRMDGSSGLMRREAASDAPVSQTQEAVDMLGRQPGQSDHSTLAAHGSPVAQVMEMPTTQGVEAAKLHAANVPHARGHTSIEPATKPHDIPWPAWARVVCGSLTTLVIMGAFSHIKGRMQNGVPRDVDRARLEVVLAETLDKVELLKAQLEDHFSESEQLVPEDDDPAVMAARVRAQDIAQRAELRAQEIHDHAGKLAAQKDQLIASASCVQDAFHDSLEAGRDRLQVFSTHEAEDLVAKVQGAMNEGSIPPYDVGWVAPSEGEEFLAPPPFWSLVQGAFATKQLHWLRDGSSLVWNLDIVMMILSGVTFGLNWKKECHDIEVWIWHIGLLAITGMDFLVRTIIVRWSDAALAVLKESRETVDKANNSVTGISLFDTFNFLQQGSEGYFEPYFRYHQITDSWAAGFMQILTLINLCWGAFGLWVTVEDIVIDSIGCNANVALTYMHVYSFFYVMFLTWSFLSMLTWVVSYVASSSMLSTTILKFAKSFDDDAMKGMPVAMTLVESFVLKNSASSLLMSKREVQQDVVQLNQQLEEMNHKLLIMQRSRAKVDEKVAEGKTQEEHLENCEQLTYDALEQAKPLVGLLAANVRTEDAVNAGIDSTAGSTSNTEQQTPASPKARQVSFADTPTASSASSSQGGLSDAASQEDPAEASDDVDSF